MRCKRIRAIDRRQESMKGERVTVIPLKSLFYSCASENGSLVVQWACEISLSSLVSDNFRQSKQF